MQVKANDGRRLDVLDTGGSGLPVLYHSGTPGGLVAYAPTVAAAQAAGLRWISYSRPGYGDSTAAPGRTVADAAADSGAVLDALGIKEFVTYGWSGGGPHALACGALLPDRCQAVAVVAGVAPYDAQDSDWFAGMGEDNIEEFGLAVQGLEALLPHLTDQAAGIAAVTAQDVVASLGNLLPPVDQAALTGELAQWLAASFRQSVSNGPLGWVDDDMAFAAPWGFTLDQVQVPSEVWQGGQDLMVPLSHGQWIAAQLPGSTLTVLPEHGHLSFIAAALPELFAQLLR
jgi:pimeloyl-ACP methyl ester carboxylesterase